MTLSELAVACYIYKMITNDADNKKDCHEQFRNDTNGSPDLCKQEHRMALLKFLNNYGCRHIAKESFKKIAPCKIGNWWKTYCKKLPKEKERLWKFEDEKLESFGELHSTLSNLVVTCRKDGVKVHMGLVGAAKTLSALRPHVFPPWDNAIQEGLSVKSYVDYLKRVREKILGLKESCKNRNIKIGEVPEKLDRSKCTVPKLIDEYYWIRFTKKLQVKEILGCWDKWNKS